jgi:hypothetical protein
MYIGRSYFSNLEIMTWARFESVQASCDVSRAGWGIDIVIETSDGTKLYINREDIWQREPFARIVGLLRGASFDNSRIKPGCPPELRATLNPN